MVQHFRFAGYPVVKSDSFVGYVKRDRLRELVNHLVSNGRQEDELVLEEEIISVTDQSVMRMSPDASLTQVGQTLLGPLWRW